MKILTPALAFLFSWMAVAAEPMPAETLLRGTPFATERWQIGSGREGPTVVILAGVRGDEPAGCMAAAAVRSWRLEKGRVIVIPQVNSPALAAGTRTTPGEPETSADLGTAFPREGGPDEARSVIGREIWSELVGLKPDHVIRLTSSARKSDDSRTTVREMNGGGALARAAARGADASGCIDRPAAAIAHGGLEPGDPARAAAERLGATAVGIDAHFSKSGTTRSRSARQQRWAVHGILRELGMLGDAASPDRLVPEDRGADPRKRLAVYTGPGAVSGSGHGPHWLVRSWAHLEDFRIVPVGAEEIRAGVLRDFDVVYFGGGLSLTQARALGESGRQAVRDFVRGGGGYVGVCAGFFLLMPSDTGESLGLIQAEVVLPDERYWDKALVDIELSDAGRECLIRPGAGHAVEIDLLRRAGGAAVARKRGGAV